MDYTVASFSPTTSPKKRLLKETHIHKSQTRITMTLILSCTMIPVPTWDLKKLNERKKKKKPRAE